MIKKYYLYIELCNYYLEKFKKKDNFYYHLQNFIYEDIKKFDTKPLNNIDNLCHYAWHIYHSLKSIEEKKNFIFVLFAMYNKIIELFKNMKFVYIKKILTTIKVNEEIFKNNYYVFDSDNFRFLIYGGDNLISDISSKSEVMELCKYFRIPVSVV
ncbi:hypothetical protein Maeo_1242 [Methanococcus aeolicus Nankai-3]|uniref:Uncharacterized protein n=1 Tax=Methanococcus aeolicus (strain ATCC BAA-1280 / DSM 17508 / OCM 812 / Nankai-3) TaxID=419665 RepID=A6UWE6_META3|nr:hypothetical protein [Methanococcus aeolicus]ABR56818.1 hypothetical protein Maeo_1242 [Methanococcus aeolicus Nankai-3]